MSQAVQIILCISLALMITATVLGWITDAINKHEEEKSEHKRFLKHIEGSLDRIEALLKEIRDMHL